MNTHEFLVKDDEGLGQGDVGNCVKTGGAFSNVPDEQTNTIIFGNSGKPASEIFAALTYRLGPSSEDPLRPIIKKGSTILSATLRVSPSASPTNDFDIRIATMKKDTRWDVDDVDHWGNFTVGPIVHVELNSNGGELAYNPPTTTAVSNNRLRHDGSTPGYGRISVGVQGQTSIISPTGTLNRIMCSYDAFPTGDSVWMEVWSFSGGPDFFDRGTLLATSDPHTSLPAAEPGFEVNSRAFTFSGSDRIELDDATRYVYVITSDSTAGVEAPRVFYGPALPGFLDASTSHGIGNGFGAPGYNTNDDMDGLFLTNDGSDTLLTNHIGTPVTFLNVANWTAGVDFDFTGLDALIQGVIDDASYSSGDAICLALDPLVSSDDTTRAFVSMSNDGVGAKLIVTWLDPDETAPLVTIDDPDNLDILSGSVTINATVSDPQGSNEVSPAGVAIVRAILNPGNLLVGTDATPIGAVYSIPFNTLLFADNNYTLRVEADDAAVPPNTGFDEITITIANGVQTALRVETQVKLSGLSTVSDQTQAANLRVTEPSVAKPRGGSQIVVKKGN